MAVIRPITDMQPLVDVERAMTVIYASDPDFVRDFAAFLKERRHGEFTFVRDSTRVYDAHTTLHSRRKGRSDM